MLQLRYADVVGALRERLATRQRLALDWPEARSAAVAVLLVDRDGAPHLPLIVRGADAPTHSSQIALPGGKCEPFDASPAATAAREAFEELGIDPARLDVLGVLDDVPTPTGFVITPVVAALGADPVVYRPDPREVAAMFEAPLSIFTDRAAAEDLGERNWRGVTYRMRAYRFNEHRVWGATARILDAVVDVIAA